MLHLIAALALLAAPPEKPVSQMSEAELDVLAKYVHHLPDPGARVEAASQRFLGTPYQLGCLGEGQGKDPDPLVRYDAVDCVTFIEEVLALTRADTASQAKDILEKIRYRGDTIAYEERNHFMEADWVPNNARKGFVRDITAEVAGADVFYDERTVTPEQWRASEVAKTIELPEAKAPIGHFKMAILPAAKAVAHAAQIPNGTFILVAHTSGPTEPNRISHTGIVLRRGSEVWVRHASSKKKQVIDEPYADFVKRFVEAYKQWPVSGFVLVQPLGEPATAAK